MGSSCRLYAAVLAAPANSGPIIYYQILFRIEHCAAHGSGTKNTFVLIAERVLKPNDISHLNSQICLDKRQGMTTRLEKVWTVDLFVFDHLLPSHPPLKVLTQGVYYERRADTLVKQFLLSHKLNFNFSQALDQSEY